MVTMLRIDVDGTITRTDAPKQDRLRWLQGQVGGLIESPSLYRYTEEPEESWIETGLDLIVNEEGKYTEPINRVASVLFGTVRHGDTVHGHVLVARADHTTGEYVDLEADDPLLVLQILAENTHMLVR